MNFSLALVWRCLCGTNARFRMLPLCQRYSNAGFEHRCTAKATLLFSPFCARCRALSTINKRFKNVHSNYSNTCTFTFVFVLSNKEYPLFALIRLLFWLNPCLCVQFSLKTVLSKLCQVAAFHKSGTCYILNRMQYHYVVCSKIIFPLSISTMTFDDRNLDLKHLTNISNSALMLVYRINTV